MKSKQVLSIEQMQHLQELGLDTSNASMYWLSYNGVSVDIPINFHLSTSDNDYVICNAYTLQDVLDALPKSLEIGKSKYEISIYMIGGKWAVDYYSEKDADIQSGECENLIDAVYSRLCWAIENGYVETNKRKYENN